MKFDEYFEKICDLCVVNNGDAWCSYVVPNYKKVLCDSDLQPSNVEDVELSWTDVLETLKLEAKRRNAITGRGRTLAAWVYDVVEGDVKPAMERGETELLNKIVALLQRDKEENEKPRRDSTILRP